MCSAHVNSLYVVVADHRFLGKLRFYASTEIRVQTSFIDRWSVGSRDIISRQTDVVVDCFDLIADTRSAIVYHDKYARPLQRNEMVMVQTRQYGSVAVDNARDTR